MTEQQVPEDGSHWRCVLGVDNAREGDIIRIEGTGISGVWATVLKNRKRCGVSWQNWGKCFVRVDTESRANFQPGSLWVFDRKLLLMSYDDGVYFHFEALGSDYKPPSGDLAWCRQSLRPFEIYVGQWWSLLAGTDLLEVVEVNEQDDWCTVRNPVGHRSQQSFSWLVENCDPALSLATTEGAKALAAAATKPQAGQIWGNTAVQVAVISVHDETRTCQLQFADCTVWRTFAWFMDFVECSGLSLHQIVRRAAPLTGYAAAHAEMLGVTSEQYRATRRKVASRRARRTAFAARTSVIPTVIEVDLFMSRGTPRGGKGVGPDLPYDPEEP